MLLAAAALALVAVGTAAAITTRAAVAPSNTALPTTSGTNVAGSTLTANAGTWSGTAPIAFAYVWQICGANGEWCHDIAGAIRPRPTRSKPMTRATLRGSRHGDELRRDRVGNQRSHGAGRDAAGTSNTAPPTISGSTATGSTLTAANGTWTGTAPITYADQWTICDNTGAACHDIAGATTNTYVLSDDAGNTVRVRITATNAAGSNSATSAASGVVGAAPATGCPTPPAGTKTIPVDQVASPARLQVAQYLITTGKLTLKTTTFSIQFLVTDTCGQPVSGALVYPTAVPYNQFTIPTEGATDANGHVTLTFTRLKGYPAAAHQQQLTMFVRARKASDPILAGISTRRLIAFAIKK